MLCVFGLTPGGEPPSSSSSSSESSTESSPRITDSETSTPNFAVSPGASSSASSAVPASLLNTTTSLSSSADATTVSAVSTYDSFNACNAALNMRERLQKFNEYRAPEQKISIGVGISTGKVSVGSIGSKQHFEFTVIGDDVNLACRLEGCTKIYGVRNMILCSDSTYKEGRWTISKIPLLFTT
jgi:hypothetical protein